MRIAVFASHNGSDMQAIIDGCKSGKIKGSVVLVISNNEDSYALVRAKNEGIDYYHINNDNEKILKLLDEYNVDIVFLAGYMKLLDNVILLKYKDRVFNIHPALLPKYGGKGMYGIHVHEAVIANHEKETGITIHKVNNEYDKGDIIAQKKVKVLKSDTPESLRDRVLVEEHKFLVKVLSKMSKEYK